MKVDGTEASPVKAVLEELERLRGMSRELMESYAARIDAEIAKVESRVLTQQGEARITSAKLRDLRDMLTLLRSAEVRTDRGRRKDFKKIDSLLGDLNMLVEQW